MPRIMYFEIGAEKPERAVAFYEKVFGWKSEKMGDSDYWLARTGPENEPGIDGAIMSKSGAQNVILSMDVPNLKEAAVKITEAGGKTGHPGIYDCRGRLLRLFH